MAEQVNSGDNWITSWEGVDRKIIFTAPGFLGILCDLIVSLHLGFIKCNIYCIIDPYDFHRLKYVRTVD
jgi:hypothetical protein